MNSIKTFSNKVDFDEASKAWRKNKLYIGYGSFRYRCLSKTKKGDMCKNKPIKDKQYCHVHSHLNT